MRFYESNSLEHIGFDFYCDIANNIVKARKEKGITQKELANLAGIKEHRLVGIDDLEKLAKVLERTVDWLIDAELDYGGKNCRYLIWPDSIPDFKLYMDAPSKRMAFLQYDRRIKECGAAYSSGRERFYVKLVGVPVSKQEIQNKFKKRTTEDLPLEPD